MNSDEDFVEIVKLISFLKLLGLIENLLINDMVLYLKVSRAHLILQSQMISNSLKKSKVYQDALKKKV